MSLDAGQRHALLGHPVGWIACGFGAGLSPFAPGTAGSLVALLVWLALRQLPTAYYVLALALALALGLLVCEWAVRKLRIADPAVVVWDEFVGLWIALAPLVFCSRGWPWIFAGFVLFRIFDIVKPWPVSWADRKVHGGLGVMLDDVLAGVYAASVLTLSLQLL